MPETLASQGDRTSTKGQFRPGQVANPNGRPKGARHKLGQSFLQKLAKHWQQYGDDALHRTWEKEPATYVKVIASLLPKEVSLTADKDLAAVLQAIDGRSRGIPGDDAVVINGEAHEVSD